jgi:hypothetical protein
MIECWGDERLDAKLRGLCPNATIKLFLGEGIPSYHPQPTGRIIAQLDQQCITMWSDGYTPTTSSVLLGISVPPYAIEYGNRLACASMIGASNAKEGAAGHATIPEDRGAEG